MPKLNLSAPWHIYRSKLAALFELDEAVNVGPVVNSENGPTVTLKVSNHVKAAALKKTLKSSVEFGNVTLNIVLEDTAEDETEVEVLKAAFAYNRLVRGVETFTDQTGTNHCYLIMEPDVLQFYADNLADYRGNISLLAEDAARDVLELTDAVVCTADLAEN